MPLQLNEQEVRRDTLSGQPEGGAISVDADYTDAADVTLVHHVTALHYDSVWVQAHNSHSAAKDLKLVLNPSDDTSTSAIDAVTVTYSIPAKDSLWILQGEVFRLRGSNTKTITAHVATADVGLIKLTGYVVRGRGGSIY